MATAVNTPFVPLEEYLNTSYKPDCDYVDGVLEDRNVGQNKHSRTQTLLSSWLVAREKQLGYKTMTEQRVQISATRVRIPDACLIQADDEEPTTLKPPMLWVEILSPDDRSGRMQIKLADVFRFGVGTV